MYVVLGFFNVVVYRDDAYIGIERSGGLCCYLTRHINALIRTQSRRTHQCFTLFDIFLLEQKLTIEVGNIDCVQVKQCNLSETSQYDVLY